MIVVAWGRLASLALILPLLALPSACTVEPGYGYGYGYDGPDIGVGIDYYEPFGFDYGGWGPSYRSGPPRGGARDFHDRGGATHGYRPAPPSHAMPSIPSAPRGVGGRGAGGGRR